MKQHTSWFKSWGWIYRLISWQGGVVYLIALAICVQVFLEVDSSSHTVSDTWYGIFPYVVPCVMLLYWVGSKTSAESA